MKENGWYFSSQYRRFEYVVDGRVIAVDVLPGGTGEGLPEGVASMTAPANIRAVATRVAQGDTAAEDELDSLLAGVNEPYQADMQAATGQGQGQGQGAAMQQTGQGGMLPSADYLNAQVDVLTIATSIADAAEKLRQREEAVARKYQGLGRPMPDISGGAETGIAPATPAAISEIAATNPDYLRAFGGIQNLAAVTEINRRQNALAAADTEITNFADWDATVEEYNALLKQREQLDVDMDQDAAATLGGTSNEQYTAVQQALWRKKASTLAEIDAKLKSLGTKMNRHPESATWHAERNLQNAYAGTQEAGSVYRDTIGREIPNEWLPYELQRKPVPKPGEAEQVPAWVANVPQGASPNLTIFGTPEQHGQAQASTAPPAPPQAPPAAALNLKAPMPQGAAAPPPAAPSGPPRAAAPGKAWVQKPDGSWEEVDAFAEGGMAGWGWTQTAAANPGGAEASRPSGAGQRIGFSGIAPSRPQQPGGAMTPLDRDVAQLQLEKQSIEQNYQQAVNQLYAQHRERMAQFSTDAALALANTPQPGAVAMLRAPMPVAA